MIGKLRGIVDETGEDWMILDVSGVGYLLGCSTRTLAAARAGEEAVLFVETYVREDQLRLFGFPSRTELELFRLLQTVQGVGAKVALAIQSILSPSELATAVSLQDKAMVARANGVGPKVAERVVTELKNKVAAFSASVPGQPAVGQMSNAATDAVSALVNLGYDKTSAAGAVARIAAAEGPDVAAEKLIRLGLRELSGA
jgi:Holliday junction DNA helicase, RuvA subunit